MPISLSKGGNINLSKEAPNLKKVLVGLGWNPRATDGAKFDLDASVFLLDESEKAAADSDFIFYKNLKSVDGSVIHTGDNTTGEGDGDDESIKVDLARIPAAKKKLAFTVTIHEAQQRKQNFGQVGGAFIRLVDEATGTEVARYDLSEDASTNTAMVFGELYRAGDDWKFRAVGQGFDGGLAAACARYGLSAS